jgi:hypothetical protein
MSQCVVMIIKRGGGLGVRSGSVRYVCCVGCDLGVGDEMFYMGTRYRYLCGNQRERVHSVCMGGKFLVVSLVCGYLERECVCVLCWLEMCVRERPFIMGCYSPNTLSTRPADWPAAYVTTSTTVISAHAAHEDTHQSQVAVSKFLGSPGNEQPIRIFVHH